MESHESNCDNTAIAFAALGSAQRLRIMQALSKAGKSGLSIGDLGACCGISGATLSHHVRILSHSGLMNQRKKGRQIICVCADSRVIQGLSDFLHSECCMGGDTPSCGESCCQSGGQSDEGENYGI